MEGRALLSLSPLDPSFNGGQPVVDLGGTSNTATRATGLNDPSAVAVQPDGKIVVVGTIDQPNNTVHGPGVAARRYNADGTPDSSFGTNGLAVISLPGGGSSGTVNGATIQSTTTTSANILIQPDGKIVFTAVEATSQTNTGGFIGTRRIVNDTVVVRLNSNGTPDTSFGTNGQVLLNAFAPAYAHLALQGDGRIILAGTDQPPQPIPAIVVVGGPTAPDTPQRYVAVQRLTTDGSLDTTFNKGAALEFPPYPYGLLTDASDIAGVAVTSSGRIVVGWTAGFDTSGKPTFSSPASTAYEVAAATSTGSIDTTFGTNGSAQGIDPQATHPTTPSYTTLAVQLDGKILVGGTDLRRLNADGSRDSTFTVSNLAISPISSLLVQADGKIVVGSNIDGQTTTNDQLHQFAVARFRTDGTADDSFGPSGVIRYTAPAPAAVTNTLRQVNALALAPNGEVVAAGVATQFADVAEPTFSPFPVATTELVLARFRTSKPGSGLTGNDYDGDGKSDLAAELNSLATFAYRKSTGGDVTEQFGVTGVGKVILAPGDYDGDGRTDVAAYLPDYGVLAYRPSSGEADVYIRFGAAATANAIPVPGDYDGDGRTDAALFDPTTATFTVHPSTGGANETVQFGTTGADPSMPVPGDYDGSGQTEFAVYIPNLGVWAYRPASGGTDVITQYGPKGDTSVIPAPGDYDGDGKTDFALFLPSSAIFMVHPSGGGTDQYTQFGAGSNLSDPVPGDYDGDGRTDLAVFIPGSAAFAYRPSGGGSDSIAGFGQPQQVGQTSPAAAYKGPIVASIPGPLVYQAPVAPAAAGILVPLVTDDGITTTTHKKGAATTT